MKRLAGSKYRGHAGHPDQSPWSKRTKKIIFPRFVFARLKDTHTDFRTYHIWCHHRRGSSFIRVEGLMDTKVWYHFPWLLPLILVCSGVCNIADRYRAYIWRREMRSMLEKLHAERDKNKLSKLSGIQDNG